MKITTEHKKEISAVIKEVETQSSGEFVVAILKKSDHYPAAHYRIALLSGGVAATLAYYLRPDISPLSLLWITFGMMGIGYLLGHIPLIKRLAITKREKDEESYQKAIELFHNNNLTKTKLRTGVLIFISELERKVYILADYGIDTKTGNHYWQEQVRLLVTSIKEHNIVNGIKQVLENLNHVIKEQFPAQQDDINELSNEVITDA